MQVSASESIRLIGYLDPSGKAATHKHQFGLLPPEAAAESVV